MHKNSNVSIIENNSYCAGKIFYGKYSILHLLIVRRYIIVLLCLFYLFLSIYESEIKDILSVNSKKKDL